MRTPLRAQLLTPRGAGAIAVWRLEGAGARALAEDLAGGSKLVPGRPRRVPLQDGGKLLDDAVVVLDRGDEVELATHGGTGVALALAAALRERGVRVLDAGEEADSRMEFELALARAPSERVLQAVAEVRIPFEREVRSLVEACSGEKRRALGRIRSLAARRRLIRALTDPPRILLAGPVNAGKSSLANALCALDLVIVSADPGTTRDLVELPLLLDGWPAVLVDGAGDREASSAVERAGQERVREAALAADLVLECLPLDGEPVHRASGSRPVHLVVGTKADLAPESALSGRLAVSSRTGAGLAELRRTLRFRLEAPELPGRLAPCPLTERQSSLLGAAASLLPMDPEGAAACLLEIVR
jgi:tRNA modification GTPase